MEKGLSVGFLTYFMVIQTKTYASLALTLLKAIYDKQRRKSHVLSPKGFFWTSKQPFAVHLLTATCIVFSVTITENFAQTQGSVWQLGFVFRFVVK